MVKTLIESGFITDHRGVRHDARGILVALSGNFPPKSRMGFVSENETDLLRRLQNEFPREFFDLLDDTIEMESSPSVENFDNLEAEVKTLLKNLHGEGITVENQIEELVGKFRENFSDCETSGSRFEKGLLFPILRECFGEPRPLSITLVFNGPQMGVVIRRQHEK